MGILDSNRKGIDSLCVLHRYAIQRQACHEAPDKVLTQTTTKAFKQVLSAIFLQTLTPVSATKNHNVIKGDGSLISMIG